MQYILDWNIRPQITILLACESLLISLFILDWLLLVTGGTASPSGATGYDLHQESRTNSHFLLLLLFQESSRPSYALPLRMWWEGDGTRVRIRVCQEADGERKKKGKITKGNLWNNDRSSSVSCLPGPASKTSKAGSQKQPYCRVIVTQDKATRAWSPGIRATLQRRRIKCYRWTTRIKRNSNSQWTKQNRSGQFQRLKHWVIFWTKSPSDSYTTNTAKPPVLISQNCDLLTPHRIWWRRRRF